RSGRPSLLLAARSCADGEVAMVRIRSIENPSRSWVATMSHKGGSAVTLADGAARSRILGPTEAVVRFGPQDVLLLAAWCGLAAGWLEVAARILCRYISPTNRLDKRSRPLISAPPLPS